MSITVCGRCGGTDERPHEECANCNPWSKVLTCCHLEAVGGTEHRDPSTRKVFISCGKDAEYEILTVRSTAEGERMAGPDPYSDQTYSCEAHLGSMLGHQPGTAEPEQITWRVRPLAPSEIGELARVEAA